MEELHKILTDLWQGSRHSVSNTVEGAATSQVNQIGYAGAKIKGLIDAAREEGRKEGLAKSKELQAIAEKIVSLDQEGNSSGDWDEGRM